jgi:hypothetical protein
MQGRSIMRLRFTVLALLSSAIVIALVPASSLAARFHHPHRNNGLTINATPNPVISGEAVLIYGQLNGPDPGNQVIKLYHRVAPSPVYTLIGITKTNSLGFYEFARAEGVVTTNRSWFTTAPGLSGVHSRTAYERVAALVSLASSSPTGTTATPITFTGAVAPNHTGETVELQEQGAVNGNVWHTLKKGLLGPGSSFSIPYRFRVPGDYVLRALFRRDDRNIAAASDTVTEQIQQQQVPDFTINSSSPIISYGQGTTISGILYLSGTTTPDPSVSVTLWGRSELGTFHTIGVPVTTGTDGSYSFNVSPTANTVYQVRTTFRPPATRHTAVLFEGVQDVVSIQASSMNVLVGQKVLFTGSVSPDKAGHVIYLQRLGADGYWHDVEINVVKPNSTYQFGWTFGNTGSKEFRVKITGGPYDVGGASPPVTIVVTLPPVNSLPPAPTATPVVTP